MDHRDFLDEHFQLTRRYFLQAGVLGMVATQVAVGGEDKEKSPAAAAKHAKPDKAGAFRDPYFTPPADFRDVSRGKPLPHRLPDEKKREIGLTRETWHLEVVSDPEHPATLGKQLTKKDGTSLDFAALLKLGEKHAVRFPKVMTCLNLGCPLGMGLWEGVPLREIIWLTQPREHVRRVFYYGYHNDDPTQMFRSSLPIGRVLEDPFDLPPVILCYKMNGEWLDSERGGPVRIVVPEAYGFKSIKWLTHVVMTDLAHANDTYMRLRAMKLKRKNYNDNRKLRVGYFRRQLGLLTLEEFCTYLGPHGKAQRVIPRHGATSSGSPGARPARR